MLLDVTITTRVLPSLYMPCGLVSSYMETSRHSSVALFIQGKIPLCVSYMEYIVESLCYVAIDILYLNF